MAYRFSEADVKRDRKGRFAEEADAAFNAELRRRVFGGELRGDSKFSKDMSNKEMDEWANENFALRPDELSEAERQALENYQGAGYQGINPYLRGVRSHSNASSVKQRVKAID